MLGYLVPAAMLHPSQLRAQLPSSSFLVNCISIDYFAVNIVWTYLINVSRVFGLMSIFIDPPFAVSLECLKSRGVGASKVVESAFDFLCSCQRT